MSTSNTAFIPQATAMLLPSLPWSTDAVIKNPAILPENISQQYQVNQIVPPSEMCWLKKADFLAKAV